MILANRGYPNERFRAPILDGHKVTVGAEAVYLVVSG